MSEYFIYESATGLVRWHTPNIPATLDAGLASILVPDGVDSGNPAAYTVQSGAIVARVFSLTDNQRSAATAAIGHYNTLMSAGFTYSGTLYQIDADSQTQIAAMCLMALGSIADPTNNPWPAGFYWIASDNGHVPMTATAMYAFGRAVGAYVSACVLRLRAIKDLIAAATDQTTLGAIDVTSGYPAASS